MKIDFVPSPYTMSRNGYSPRWLILHGTAGGNSAEAIAGWFQNPSAQVSAHYIVGPAGRVIQSVRESEAAWANGVIEDGADPWWNDTPNPNFVTVSIEFVKASKDNGDQLTSKQKEIGFELIRQICKRENIPARPADETGGITGHFSIAPQSRSRCPGPFPWEELWSYLGGTTEVISIDMPEISQYFDEINEKRWRCKSNRLDVAYAILDYYKRFGGGKLCGLTALGLPKSKEIYSIPGAALQVFERAIVVFDPDHKIDTPPGAGVCYTIALDSDIARALLCSETDQVQQELAEKLEDEKDQHEEEIARLQAQLEEKLRLLKKIAVLTAPYSNR